MQETRRFHLRLKDSINAHSPTGAFGIFAPTHATLKHPNDSVDDFQWSARAHRKRRYRRLDDKGRPREEAETFWVKLRRFGKLEWKETSWWIAIFFTFGSIVWVINGFIVFLPQIKPDKYAVNNVGGGWTAWLGATIFEFGAVTALFEAMNRRLTLAGIMGGGDSPGDDEERALKGQQSNNENGISSPKRKRKLIFFPYKRALWSEIGFWGAFSQFWAATIFWISGWTGIPEIFTPIQNKGSALENGIYWVPQIIGASGFVIASTLYMLESQKKWWKPELTSLGWHVGFWNLIGAIGFDLCGIFGISTFVPCRRETELVNDTEHLFDLAVQPANPGGDDQQSGDGDVDKKADRGGKTNGDGNVEKPAPNGAQNPTEGMQRNLSGVE